MEKNKDDWWHYKEDYVQESFDESEWQRKSNLWSENYLWLPQVILAYEDFRANHPITES